MNDVNFINFWFNYSTLIYPNRKLAVFSVQLLIVLLLLLLFVHNVYESFSRYYNNSTPYELFLNYK